MVSTTSKAHKETIDDNDGNVYLTVTYADDIPNMRRGFESIPYIKSIISTYKAYYKLGNYWCDSDPDTDKYLCGAWDMYCALYKNLAANNKDERRGS